MLLEKTAQIRLVGEVQPVGNLLYREFRGLEQHLDLEDHRAVDELLGRRVGHAADDRGQITRRYTKPVGIEYHLALLRAMFVHKSHETLEKIGLARGARLRMHIGSKPPRFVESLQQDVLQPVANNCIAEMLSRSR